MKPVKTIMILCGMGFGSSFIVKTNVERVLSELGYENVKVEHSDVSSAYEGMADLVVCGTELTESCERYGPVVALNNLFDMDELRMKLETFLSHQAD